MRLKPWGRDFEWSVIQAPAQSRVSSAVILDCSGLAGSLKSPRTENSQTCLSPIPLACCPHEENISLHIQSEPLLLIFIINIAMNEIMTFPLSPKVLYIYKEYFLMVNSVGILFI